MMSRRFLVRFAALGVTGALIASCGASSSSRSTGPEETAGTPTSAAGGSGDGAEPANGAQASMGAEAPSGVAAPGEAPGPAVPTVATDAKGGQSKGEGGAGDANAGAATGANGASEAMGGATAPSASSAAAAPTSTGFVSPFPSSVTRPRIMIIGDSISAGPGCYKKYLLADLNSQGYSNFDFVGAYTDDCGGGVRHSARSCSTAQQYTGASFSLAAGSCNPSGTFAGLAPLATTYHPDLLMIQLGVNDVWGGRTTDAILADYTTLVEQARAENPNMVIAVAQIQQIRPTSDANPDAVFERAQQLIMAVPSWAQSQSRPESPIFVADLWTNSDSTQTLDGVHPDDAGAQRMGQNWFNTLEGVLNHD
jgi:acyl-CoA thioesterase-1